MYAWVHECGWERSAVSASLLQFRPRSIALVHYFPRAEMRAATPWRPINVCLFVFVEISQRNVRIKRVQMPPNVFVFVCIKICISVQSVSVGVPVGVVVLIILIGFVYLWQSSPVRWENAS